jgi:solute carrier family 25 phosphate transporter 23/24/25/41
MSPSTLSEFMTSLTSSPYSDSISFQEFRDFLLLLPRRVSTKEIYRFYEVRKFLGDDGRGTARVTMEGACPPISHVAGLTIWSTDIIPSLPTPGDVSLSAEDKPPNYLIYRPPAVQLQQVPSRDHDRTPSDSENDNVDDDDDDDDGLLHEHHMEDDHHGWLGGETALKFLMAGGVAGAGQRHSRIPRSQISSRRSLACEQYRGHPRLHSIVSRFFSLRDHQTSAVLPCTRTRACGGRRLYLRSRGYTPKVASPLFGWAMGCPS